MSEEISWSTSYGEHRAEIALRADGSLWWRVISKGVEVLASARLQLCVRGDGDLMHDLLVVSEQRQRISEEYDVVVGKRVGRHSVDHEELQIRLRAGSGIEISVVVRAAPDGVALRSVLHDCEGRHVYGGDVPLCFRPNARAWMQSYTPWYEMPRYSTTLDAIGSGDYGFPLLVECGDDLFALVSESDLDGRYGGSLARYAGDGRFDVSLADDVLVDRMDLCTPWRAVLIGRLADIVASDLVNDLAPAAFAPPAEWIQPGRGGWSWWSDFYSGSSFEHQTRWLDYAAQRGWEHLLVDCGWDAAWMPELVAAASGKDMGVFVWVAWDNIGDAEAQKKLALWASWGVAGIKVDFMESESQERYRWYDAIITEAGRVGLMVNFHGSVIPRGWARTYPHVMTYEAVRGAEYYVFYGDPLTAEHNTILPFSRNVIGSADYTPVTFSAKNRDTSEGHELALAVVLESGLTHFADHIDEYAKRPIAEHVLEQVPAVWNETRLLAGYPGDLAVLARRDGDHWFVGGISAGPPRALELALDFLNNGSWTVEVVTDDGNGGLNSTITSMEPGCRLPVALVEHGGFVALLSPADTVARAPRIASQFALSVEPQLAAITPGDSVTVTVRTGMAEQDSVTVPPGWPAAVRLTATGDPEGVTSTWQVTAPIDLLPGTVGVIQVAVQTIGRRRADVAHARFVAPLAAGVTAAAGLQPVAASNGFGPVERDSSNGGGDPNDGTTMSIAGQTYTTGLGVCAPSRVDFFVGGSAARFTAVVGVDDESEPGTADAVCRVLLDGVVAQRLTLSRDANPMSIDIDVRNASVVSLVVETLDPTMPGAHVDWANAEFHAEARPL